MATSTLASARNTVGFMSTLADRIVAVMEARGLAASQWSLMAKLAKGHVGSIKRGEIDDVQVETLAALAEAARVSYRWLATGKGAMDDTDAAPSPRGEIAVERVAEPAPDASLASDLDRALHRAMDATRFEPIDFDEARRVLRETYRKRVEGADMTSVARRALEAVRDARIAGEPVTAVDVLARIAYGRT